MRYNENMKFLLYLLILFVCHSPFALADKEELKIATFVEPPFVDLVKGKLMGEHIDIARLLAKSVNLKPVFIRCPFVRCLTMVKRGHADMIFGIRKLPEREKNLVFLEPPYMVQHYPLRFFTLASKKVAINSFDDLQHLTVGVLRGASYFDLFDKDKSITKVELTSRPQLLNMLLRDRIDAFIEREESILPLLPLEEYLEKFSLANYQFDDAVNSYIAISKHSNIKVYTERLSEKLQKLVASGTIRKIRMKSYN